MPYRKRAPILAEMFSCTQRTSQRMNFELIPTVKMETRHPIGGPFSREFFGICNHCGVIFVGFFGKNTPYGKTFKIFKTLFRKFSTPHRSTLLYSNVVKFARREIDEIVRYLPNIKFRLPLKLSLLRGSRPKFARASFRHLPHSVPNFIQIGSLSAEL